jgi:hypothetical protein
MNFVIFGSHRFFDTQILSANEMEQGWIDKSLNLQKNLKELSITALSSESRGIHLPAHQLPIIVQSLLFSSRKRTWKDRRGPAESGPSCFYFLLDISVSFSNIKNAALKANYADESIASRDVRLHHLKADGCFGGALGDSFRTAFPLAQNNSLLPARADCKYPGAFHAGCADDAPYQRIELSRLAVFFC